MTTLYKLSAEYKKAFDELRELGFEQSEIKDSLSIMEGSIADKIKNVAFHRQNTLLVLDGKKALIAKLQAEAKTLENEADRLYRYIDDNMKFAKLDNVDCEYFKIKYVKNRGSLQVDDMALIPSDYINSKTTESVDKKALKAAIDAGLVCKGASILKGTRLQIK